MFSFTNTNDLRELAIYFEKHGHYPYYDEYMDLYIELNQNRKKNDPEIIVTPDMMSYGAQQFAQYWIKRFINGATIGNVYYCGEHLFYLNVCSIGQVSSNDSGIFKDGTKKLRKVGTRTVGFPSFWDEDYKYFTTCDIAKRGVYAKKENGILVESYVDAYHRIYGDIDLNLVLNEDNLSGGLNHLLLKSRGVGFSWKLANWNVYNLFLKRDIDNFIFAANSEYLGDKDGIMAKFVKLRSFVQANAWFLRKTFYKQSISDYSFATGYKESIGGAEITVGFNSAVYGIIIDGDTDKGRGKRGNGSFEEFGSFPGVADTWKKFDSSTNEYGTIFGQSRGGGTGGDSGEGYADLEKMFYDPEPYRLITFKNPYEESYKGKGVNMFTPGYINVSYRDKDGNSLIAESKVIMDAERAKLKESPDPTMYIDHCAEKPYTPREAFNARGNNILPIDLLKEQLSYLVLTNVDRKICRYGDFYQSESGIKFKIENRLPYEAYPVVAGDKESCVVILKEPHRINGKVPDNLYVIAVDPYSDEEATSSPSIGSFVCREQVNTLTQSKGGLEVSWYDGRPEGHDGQDRFCRRLFQMAEYYNAKIVIENNEKGNIVHYARTHKDTKGRKLTEYLHEQLALGYDVRIATKKNMHREFGVHMTGPRKLQGMKDYQEDLLTPRGYKDNGDDKEVTLLTNVNFIYNRGLLQEAILYKGDNADRISARIVMMFAIKEFEDKGKRIGIPKVKQDSFFSKPLFQ